MSTHNIGFYEDLTKIIFELSSNIIKYAPYFFCCENQNYPILRRKQSASNVSNIVAVFCGDQKISDSKLV